ncbi:MAG: hypothetical protein JNJ41_19265 [Bacteroidia bacterium]|nr:hypothetical protein [Bacteroidia bacterium]
MKWLKDNVAIIVIFSIFLIPVGFIVFVAVKSIWTLRYEIIRSVVILLACIGAYALFKFFKQPEQNK